MGKLENKEIRNRGDSFTCGVETQNTQPCNNQTHKILKSFIKMEALNLILNQLLAMLVLWAARVVVLVIWMIILIILGGVGRMVDFL